MDLNEVPDDHMVIEAKLVGINGGNCNFGLNGSRMRVDDVEQKCKDIELECLGLEIRSKDMKLEAIREKIRVLEGEKIGIEEEVKGLRKKMAVLEGRDICEEVGGGFGLDDKNFDLESDEFLKYDQLVIENKVLECEKSVVLKDAEEWKRKCKELELRVGELERGLKSRCKDGVLFGKKEGANDDNDVSASRFYGASTPAAIDEVIKLEGSPFMKAHVKRRLAFQYERCDEKIAPSTPAVALAPSTAVIDIDSDNEPDVPVKPGPHIENEVTPLEMSGVGPVEIDDELDEEYQGDSNGKESLVTPKRKRDTKVVTSDDELEDYEVMPTKRAFRISDSENEGEDDDTLPLKQIFSKVQGICKSGDEDDEDDDDDIPISQLQTTRAQGSRQTAELHVGTSSRQGSDSLSDSSTLARKRLVKRGLSTRRTRQPVELCMGTSSCEGTDSLSDSSTLPRRRLVKRGQSTQRTRQPAELRVGTSSCEGSDGLSDSSILPRRRRVKREQGTQRTRQETRRVRGSLKKKYVDDDETEAADSESDASLDNFIVNDSDAENLEDNSSDGSDPSQKLEESSDDDVDFGQILSTLQRRRDAHSGWALVGDMLSDLGKDTELCMRGVCAIYRRQTSDEKLFKDSIVQNGRGFSKFDAPRGTQLGEFLTGGIEGRNLVITVEELKEFDPAGPEKCRELANRYSRQLFEIYVNKECPFFPGAPYDC